MISSIILENYFKKTKILFLFCLLFSCRIFSQVTDTSDYFPLHVGDKWWYYIIDPYNAYKYIEITGIKQIGDTNYFVMDSVNFYRKDSTGNVYKRIIDIDQLYFKINAQRGEQWFINDKWGLFYMKLTIDKFTEYTQLGKLENCKDYSYKIYYPLISDVDKAYTLTPKIGICAFIADPNREVNGWITRAMINNKFFGGPFKVLVYSLNSAGSRIYSVENIDLKSSFLIRFNTDIDSNIIRDKFRIISQKIGEVQLSLVIANSYFNMKAYRVYPSNELQPSDTITLKISGDLKDIYGEGFDGNGNGVYEGSPSDDYIDTFYTKEITGINNVSIEPDNFLIYQNYPNPFNNETIIKFSIPERGVVDINIYNLLGQKVKTMLLGEKNAGNHHIVWDAKDNNGKNLVSGVYIIQIRWNNLRKIINTLYLK